MQAFNFSTSKKMQVSHLIILNIAAEPSDWFYIGDNGLSEVMRFLHCQDTLFKLHRWPWLPSTQQIVCCCNIFHSDKPEANTSIIRHFMCRGKQEKLLSSLSLSDQPLFLLLFSCLGLSVVRNPAGTSLSLFVMSDFRQTPIFTFCNSSSRSSLTLSCLKGSM